MDDPKAVWEKLAEMYKSVFDAFVDSYLVKLHNLKMKDNEKVMSYVNRLTEIENELATVGHSLDESEKRRSLLRGLRDEFNVTARVIRAMLITFTKAVSKLAVEEGSRETDPPSEDSESKALDTFQSVKYKCSHCGRGGHTADRCFHNPSSKMYRNEFPFKNGNGNKNRGQSGSSQDKRKGKQNDDPGEKVANFAFKANVALMSKSVLRGEVILPFTMKEKRFVDSPSTLQICNKEENFEMLTKQNRRPDEVGEVQLVDGHGIGIIRRTTFIDGRKQQVMMRAVLYVATIICNLISFSKTLRSGFKITFDGGEENEEFCEIMHKETEIVNLRGIELSEGIYEEVFRPTARNKAFVSTGMKQDVSHRIGDWLMLTVM